MFNANLIIAFYIFEC